MPYFVSAVKRRIDSVLVALTVALVVFVSGYWGIHRGIFGPEGSEEARMATRSSHGPDPDHPHESSVPAEAPASAEVVPDPSEAAVDDG